MLRSIPAVAVLTLISVAACNTDAPVAPQEAAHSHGISHMRTADLNRQLVALRQATAQFHNFGKTVEAAGYDAPITPCWEHRTLGAMGYHYGKPALIRDGAVSLLEPELLMYEPGPGGQMRLVGMEYIVFIEDWEEIHGENAAPPLLLGQEFHPHSVLPIYKLHIWLWRDNPRGIFADWNPKVSCEHAAETEYFD
jgi:hypothetical protein